MYRRIISTLPLILFCLISTVAGASKTNGPALTISGPDGKVCYGMEVALEASGNSNFTYEWLPKNFFVDNTSKKVIAHVKKTTIFTVIRKSKDNSQVDTARFTVHVGEEKVDLFGENFVCKGDSAYIELPHSYDNTVWSTGEKTQGIWVKKGGIYRVEASEKCDAIRGEIHVQDRTKPLALITHEKPLDICKGQEVELKVFGNYKEFQWSTGADASSIIVKEAGEIKLSVSNECGVSEDVVEVTVHSVSASFIPSKTEENVPFKVFLKNESKGTAKNSWYVNGELFSTEENPNLKIEEEGEYDVELVRENEFGCKQKMSYGTIQALPPVQPAVSPDKLVIFPNSFTPNGDGLNDFFEFQSNYLEEVHFIVFDRWGREIFESTGNSGWDGTLPGGELASQGKYIILFDYINLEGEPVSRQTTVNLLR